MYSSRSGFFDDNCSVSKAFESNAVKLPKSYVTGIGFSTVTDLLEAC